MSLAILDIQHLGKSGKNDLGASHDLDGDGLISQGENEAELTPIYAAAAKAVLEAAGVEVVVLKSGAYSSRWKKASKLAAATDGPVAYVACHLNAGGGDYGLVCYDSRSSGGSRLARELGAALRLEFSTPELRRVLADERAATSKDAVGFPRAFHTIAGIYSGPANLSGVCFEPLFLDGHARHFGELTPTEAATRKRSVDEHAKSFAHLEEGDRPPRAPTAGELRASDRLDKTLDRIGSALAAGILEWIRIRG